ncbi:hypothetical protein N7504_010826, partial [Penicillium tannophilum]
LLFTTVHVSSSLIKKLSFCDIKPDDLFYAVYLLILLSASNVLVLRPRNSLSNRSLKVIYKRYDIILKYPYATKKDTNNISLLKDYRSIVIKGGIKRVSSISI